MSRASHRAPSGARLTWLVGGLLSLAGCAAALHQVGAGEAHALVELRFEHASRDLLYEDAVRIDGAEEHKVKSGERVRLRPGMHWLELVAIGSRYGLDTVPVVKPGPCIDPLCARTISVTEPQFALRETGQERCAAQLDIEVGPNTTTVARLRVAADQTCAASVSPARAALVLP